jgi:carboxylesterase type B
MVIIRNRDNSQDKTEMLSDNFVSNSVCLEMSANKVRVSQGIVRGCEEKLPNGRSFLRFSGIPYAKPPINELRFRSPQKLFKFVEDEIDCTRERDACFHKSTLNREYVGSEDCLNLNVYVPVPDDSSKKLAVMVYIHGGALKYDSNSKLLYVSV